MAQKMTKRTKVALWLLISPTALFLLAVALYALSNYYFSSSDPTNELILTSSETLVKSIINIFLFICGAVSVITWLPGLITGIILLTTKKK